jgi:Domain of unknown function (DUF4157)
VLWRSGRDGELRARGVESTTPSRAARAGTAASHGPGGAHWSRLYALLDHRSSAADENHAPAERDADHAADLAMHAPAAHPVERAGTAPSATGATPAIASAAARGSSRELDPTARAFLEPRLGRDFSHVRVHDDAAAGDAARKLGARAFTLGSDIVFGAGRYQPDTHEGRHLLAHELTHTVQQSETGHASVQRTVELRAPGHGVPSAFGRAQELVDQLNAQSAAVHYELAADGHTLVQNVLNAATMTRFDHQMQGFCGPGAVIPLLLVTHRATVLGPTGAQEPVLQDDWATGFFDLDDVLADRDHETFQTQMVHFLRERQATRNYAHRMGHFPHTAATIGATIATFNRAHAAGHEAEAETFQDIVGDPSIRFLYNEPRGNTFVVAFRSAEGYRIFKVFPHVNRRLATDAHVFAELPGDPTHLTIAQLRAHRAAHPVVPAPAPAQGP